MAVQLSKTIFDSEANLSRFTVGPRKGVNFNGQKGGTGPRNRLISASILALPDAYLHFTLDTNARNHLLEPYRTLTKNRREKAHDSLASCILTKAVKRYCMTRKELLPVVHSAIFYIYMYIYIYRTYYEGSLRWLLKLKNPEGQLARWLDHISTSDVI